MIKLLTKANRSIGIFEGMSNQVPDIDLFVSMYMQKEALLSSQIEGTQDFGILKLTENVRRNRVFAYEEYLSILRKDT